MAWSASATDVVWERLHLEIQKQPHVRKAWNHELEEPWFLAQPCIYLLAYPVPQPLAYEINVPIFFRSYRELRSSMAAIVRLLFDILHNNPGAEYGILLQSLRPESPCGTQSTYAVSLRIQLVKRSKNTEEEIVW